MNLSIDKAVVFEGDETETTIEIDNSEFEVDDKGNLIVTGKSSGTKVGYFPATKWDCVYARREDE